MKKILILLAVSFISGTTVFAQKLQTGRNGVVDVNSNSTVQMDSFNASMHRHQIPEGIDMQGTNPHVNSYAQDTAILNNKYKVKAARNSSSNINMMGTNPKRNTYAKDTAIIRKYHIGK